MTSLANAVVRKAKLKQYENLGLIFKKFPKDIPWKLLCIHGASAASKGRTYAQEGVLILLAPDNMKFDPKVHTINGENVEEQIFGGTAHIPFSHGSKAKRVSYSTSFWDFGCDLRFGDCDFGEPTFSRTLDAREEAHTSTAGSIAGIWHSLLACGLLHRLPRLLVADSGLYSLTSRQKPAHLHPSDPRSQNSRTHQMDDTHPIHWPRWWFRDLYFLLSTGQVDFANEPGHAIEARRLPKIKDFTEDDLELGDDKWLESYMTAEDLQAIQLYLHYITKHLDDINWVEHQGQFLAAEFPVLRQRGQPSTAEQDLWQGAMQRRRLWRRNNNSFTRPAIRTGHHFVSHFGGDFLPLWSTMAFLEATVGHEDSFRRAHQQSFAAEHREVDRFGMSPWRSDSGIGCFEKTVCRQPWRLGNTFPSSSTCVTTSWRTCTTTSTFSRSTTCSWRTRWRKRRWSDITSTWTWDPKGKTFPKRCLEITRWRTRRARQWRVRGGVWSYRWSFFRWFHPRPERVRTTSSTST